MAKHPSRVKEKLKDAGKTGGGAPKVLSDGNHLCFRILGENNPKLKQVPDGLHNTAEIPMNDAMVTEGIEEQEKPESSSKKKKSRVPDEQSLHDLHKRF